MVTKCMDVLEHVYVSYTCKVHLIFLKKFYKDFLNEDRVERNNNQMIVNEQPQNTARAISKGLKKVVRWLASQYEC